MTFTWLPASSRNPFMYQIANRLPPTHILKYPVWAYEAIGSIVAILRKEWFVHLHLKDAVRTNYLVRDVVSVTLSAPTSPLAWLLKQVIDWISCECIVCRPTPTGKWIGNLLSHSVECLAHFSRSDGELSRNCCVIKLGLQLVITVYHRCETQEDQSFDITLSSHLPMWF